MAKVHVPQLEGERIRYNDDTWEFTGEISIGQNGSVIEAGARKPDRVRGSRGTLRFQLQDPPASINPGNPGDFDLELGRGGGEVTMLLRRRHASDRYALSSVSYQ